MRCPRTSYGLHVSGPSLFFIHSSEIPFSINSSTRGVRSRISMDLFRLNCMTGEETIVLVSELMPLLFYLPTQSIHHHQFPNHIQQFNPPIHFFLPPPH